MIHIIFILIIASIVFNALYSSLNRVNNTIYHWFEVLTVLTLFSLGYFVSQYTYTEDYITIVMIYITLRFGLYSAIFNIIIKQPLNYLGNWGIDRFLKFILYTKLNQGGDAILWFYFMSIFIGVGLYLGLLFN